MARGTITSKGQITIPKQVRDDLGLRAGTVVEFSRDEDGGYRLSVARDGHRLVDLAGSIAYQGPPVSVAEMEEAIAEGAVESGL